jgi:hypothetical protein
MAFLQNLMIGATGRPTVHGSITADTWPDRAANALLGIMLLVENKDNTSLPGLQTVMGLMALLSQRKFDEIEKLDGFMKEILNTLAAEEEKTTEEEK